jgi:DNA-binding MarR family transcriptional regulator
VSVAIFSEELQALGLTPLQFAVLHEVSRHPGLDQRSLARRVALDASTTGGVVDRLEARGALQRQLSPDDRRVRRLHLTDAGQALLQQATPPVQRVQDRLLAPLPVEQQTQLIGLLHTLLQGHQDAPADD